MFQAATEEKLPPLHTEEGVKAFVEMMFPLIKRNIEKDGYLVPVSFVLATKDPRTGKELPTLSPIVVAPETLGSDDDKDFYVSGLKKVIQKSGAVGVVIVQESWTLSAGGVDPTELRTYLDSGKRIADHPRREEVVMILVEHSKILHGISYFAKIARDSNDKIPLQPLKATPGDPRNTGRFTGFLQHLN